ncbi:tetratricopeptide repeat protein [Winogradskyella sp.]|uniref:tetratricopeptide repeat protein n=1 Tax=Winogradskyella sp. TaxID=1883156 RepID=UPI00261BF611|nr:tetratricopeptide repeat protein [Winogradskyella sp.]
MSIEDDILIEKYLRGALPEADQKAFLDRLASDAVFKEQYNLEKQLFDALNEDRWSFSNVDGVEIDAYKEILEGEDVQNLKKTLTEVNTRFNNSNQKKTKSKTIYYYLAAASIVVFLGVQFFFNHNPSSQELYNEYIELNDLPSFASRAHDSGELPKAQQLFEDKKYKEALIIFQEQLGASEFEGNVFLYLGISQIELGEYSAAEKTFEDLINSDLLDSKKGYWYKALLYLKQDRVEETKEVLNKIVVDRLFNSEKARALLAELN